MKIRTVSYNNRRKGFNVATRRGCLWFPYSKLEVRPVANDPIAGVSVDKDLGGEGFTYTMESGREGTVHIEQVLDYNKDPVYLRDMVLYRLTIEASRRIEKSPLSMREISRRLKTSPAQLYRLLDQTNYNKSVDQMLSLLAVLDCEVDLVVRKKSA